MTRFISGLLMIVAVIAGIIFAISAFLGPDDLRGCPKGPDGSTACQKADAIIAISGGDTEARTFEAVRLYKAGWADRLIFSGAARDEKSPSNALTMKRQAIEAGVSANAIGIEELARDTAENASRTRQLAAEQGLKRVILVTSAYHQRRAGMEFKRVFSDTTILNHPVSNDRHWSEVWWLTPVGWWLALSELVKTAFVAFRGGA